MRFSYKLLRGVRMVIVSRRNTSSYRHAPRVSPETMDRYISGKMHRNPKHAAKVIFQSGHPEVNPPPEASTMPGFGLWHSVLQKACEGKDRYVSVEDWEKLTQEFPTHIPVENRRTGLFGALMGLCASFEYHQCGDSIIDYHKSKNIPLNVAIGAKYVKLCGRSNAPNAEEKIFHAYDELKKLSRLGIFDAATCENIIEALYKTSRWKECYKLLEMIDFTGRAGSVSVSYVINAAFRHDDTDFAWKLLRRQRDAQSSPTPVAFAGWWDYAKRKGHDAVLEMLSFTAEVEWFLPFEVAKDLKLWKERDKSGIWQGRFTTVSIKGECKACQEYMELIVVRKEEFDKLRENFLKLVVETSDVFIRTNPAELSRYREFISENAPFDLIIDGLNVAYLQNSDTATPRSLAKQLRLVVEHVTLRRPKKVLILGRKHMKNWPADEMKKIYNVATCFFAENLSQDDPFLLYAALYSGMACDFMSGDLMRDHRFKLAVQDEELRKTFLKWQRSHQLTLLKVHPDGTVRIKPPMKYNTVPQWTSTSMHIPYDSGMLRGLHELPTSWLCLADFACSAQGEVSRDTT